MRFYPVVLLLAAGTLAIAPDAHARGRRSAAGLYQPRHEIVLEAGAVVPHGDLAGDFFTTDQGLDAGNGYELGLRYRYYLSDRLVVSPAFHYANLGNREGITTIDGHDRGFEICTSIYRYGIDLQHFFGPAGGQVRGFVSAGAALYYNRYRDIIQGQGEFVTGSNDLGYSAGAGLVLGPIELSASYEIDRAVNASLPSATGNEDFNWDHLVVRAGVSLGRL